MMMFVIWALILVYLVLGVFSLRNARIGAWLSMMSYNSPYLTFFVVLPCTILLWPLLQPWKD